MITTVQTICDWVDAFAPFKTAEEYDNVGLITGRGDTPVTRILTALDCTLPVVMEAERLGAQVILTHHPLLFHARKNVTEEDAEGKILCALIRGHMALVAAHTNLDRAAGGTGDVLARLFSLKDSRGDGFLRLGELPAPLTAKALRNTAAELLCAPVRLYGDPAILVSRLAVAAGAYDEGFAEAFALGAQALLTGEVRHHNAVTAVAQGMVLLEGGHYATEAPGLRALGECLQKDLNRLQCSVEVYHFPGVPYQGALDR